MQYYLNSLKKNQLFNLKNYSMKIFQKVLRVTIILIVAIFSLAMVGFVMFP